MVKLVESKDWFLRVLFMSAIVVISGSCVLSPDEYDSSADQGTYSGTLTVYGGQGSTASFSQRVCPKITASLSVEGDQVTLTTTDDYSPVTPDGDVITSHTVSGTIYANNKFQLETGWTIGATTQTIDLMTLRVCEASPPTNPISFTKLLFHFS